MPQSSYAQSNFLGGEWSPYSQGRFDDEHYRSALAVCRNAYPLEEGCWTRRPGTRFCGTTRNGVQALLREFHFQANAPYIMEFTPGHIRFWSGPNLVLDAPKLGIVAISSANPAVVNTVLPHPWNTGDQVMFLRAPGDSSSAAEALLNRQWAITVIDTTHVSISDPITGLGFDGSTINVAGEELYIQRITDIALVDGLYGVPYTATDIANGDIVVVQAIEDYLNRVIILNPNNAPLCLTNLTPPTVNAAATFSFTFEEFDDGPYQDLVDDGSTLVPSAYSFPNVTLSITFQTWSNSTSYSAGQTVTYSGLPYTSLINSNLNNNPGTDTAAWQQQSSTESIGQGHGFVSTDLNRAIRIFSEPAAWNSGTAYAVGANVSYGGGYWTALVANTGVEPDQNPTDWAISTTAAAWTWGRITSVVSSAQVNLLLLGGPILNPTVPIESYQIDAFSTTQGWPTCGCYHEGRLWLSGAMPNRVDASAPNDIFNWSPTGPDGTVADSNAIAEELNATDVNAARWLLSNHQGIIIGTQAGEWLAQASALNDPLTPTSIQIHRVTKFGVDPVQPLETPMSSVFVQRYGKKVIEYISDVYSGKFSGTNVAIKAKHLTAPGISELAYTQEATPVVWARMDDGTLAGMTYRRDSPFGTTPASFSGWHRHDLGSGRLVESIAAGPSADGNLDTLFMATNDPTTNIRWVELLTDLFDEDTPITESWFVDAGAPPVAMDTNGTTITLSGYHYLAGKTVQVWGAGLDLGDYTVSSNGQITLTIGTPPLFTQAYLNELTAEGNIFGDVGVVVNVVQPGVNIPVVSAIQNFAPVGGHTAPVDATAFVDWNTNALYSSTLGLYSTTGNGFYKFNVNTGGQTTFVAGSSITGFTGYCNAGVIGSDGYFYVYSSVSNYGKISKFDPNTFALDATIGTESGTGGIPTPNQMLGVAAGTSNFLVISGNYALNGDKGAIIQTDGSMTQTALLTSGAGVQNFLCPGPSFASGTVAMGSCYMVGCDGPSTSASGTSTPIVINRIVIESTGAYTVTQVASIAPSAFSASLFAQFPTTGAFYDPADGNVIITVNIYQGNSYLAKINVSTGAVMWSTQIVGLQASTGANFTNFTLKGGRLALLVNGTGVGSPVTLLWLNTLTGAIISNNLIPGFSRDAQAYDGNTGRIVSYCTSYNSATSGAPTPIGTTPSSFTNEYAIFYGNNPAPNPNLFGPFVVGYTFTSQGQLLRAIEPQQAGAANGPALGKTRRAQMYGALLCNAQGVQIGTNFTTMHAIPLKSPGGNPYTLLQLFSGVVWDTLEDQYSFDSQPAWQVTRPYPCTLLSLEAFLQTQDRG